MVAEMYFEQHYKYTYLCNWVQMQFNFSNNIQFKLIPIIKQKQLLSLIFKRFYISYVKSYMLVVNEYENIPPAYVRNMATLFSLINAPR